MKTNAAAPGLAAGRVLGIDPGLDTTGYALVETIAGRLVVREAGVIRTTRDESLGSRIEQIYDGTCEIIRALEPQLMAVEELHSAYEHPQTAILMGHARGVICLAAAQEGMPIASYRPAHVKKMLTGSGRASKEQMQRAVRCLLGMAELPEPADVADAIAVALCHVHAARQSAVAGPASRSAVSRAAARARRRSGVQVAPAPRGTPAP